MKLFLILLLMTTTLFAEKPTVFVSIPPQAWLVKSLAEDQVNVETLLPLGADPHTFDPTARQLSNLARASLYVTIGIPFEQSLTTRLRTLCPNMPTAAMDAGVQKRGGGCSGYHHEGHHHAEDPHIWSAPPCMAQMATNTLAAIQKLHGIDPGRLAAAFQKTIKQIQDFDRSFRDARKETTHPVWVVYHDSFSYLTDAYDIHTLVIEQDGKPQSARHLAHLIREARAAKASFIITSPRQETRHAQTIAEQLHAKLIPVDVLQEDWPTMMKQLITLLRN